MLCMFTATHLTGMAHLPNIQSSTFTQDTAHARAPTAKDITLTPHDRYKDNLRNVRNQLKTDKFDQLRRLHVPHQTLMMETDTVSETLDIHSKQMRLIILVTIKFDAVTIKENVSLC